MLQRGYVGVRQQEAASSSWVQCPVPVVSLIVTLEGPVRAGGQVLPHSWLGGLAGECQLVTLGASHASLDVKLNPLGAYALCGRSLRELDGGFIGLDELFGSDGEQLEDQLYDADGWQACFGVLERFLLDRAAEAPQPHPLVAAAWSKLRETAGTARIGTLAGQLGCSRRHLTALFHEQTGLAPKTAARLLRFARVREHIRAMPDRWADIAYYYGYCDQAHLNRDFRELAQTTPTEFVAHLRSDVAASLG